MSISSKYLCNVMWLMIITWCFRFFDCETLILVISYFYHQVTCSLEWEKNTWLFFSGALLLEGKKNAKSSYNLFFFSSFIHFFCSPEVNFLQIIFNCEILFWEAVGILSFIIGFLLLVGILCDCKFLIFLLGNWNLRILQSFPFKDKGKSINSSLTLERWLKGRIQKIMKK